MSDIQTLKLQLFPGQARSHPSLGPSLGQKGINMMEFISKFNEASSNYHETALLNTKVRVKGKNFTVSCGFIPFSLLVKRRIIFQKLSGSVADSVVLTSLDLYMLTLLKKKDPRFKYQTLPCIASVLLGSLRSMHVRMVE